MDVTKTADTPSVESILSAIVDAIVTIDDRGVIQSVNPAAEKIFGYSSREMIGKNVSILIPRSFIRAHDEGLKKYLKTGQAKVIGAGREVFGRKRDGTTFPIYLGVSEGHREGDRRFFTGIIRDITELKHYQEDLKKQSDFTTTVLNTVRSLVLVLDRRGRIVGFNRACEEMTGYLLREVVGKPFWNFFLAADERSAAVNHFLNWKTGLTANNFETHWLTKSGDKRLIAWSNSLLFDGQKYPEYLIGTGIDITEQRQLEEMVLEITKKEQQRLGQELHDGIAQNLVSTALVAKLLEKKLAKELPSAALELKRVVGMVNEAVSQSRQLAQGLYAPEIHSEDMASLIKRFARDTEKAFGIKVGVHLASDVHISDDCTAAHLYRIAREAVSNAVKHGQCKHIRISLKKMNASEARFRIESDGKRFLKPGRSEGLGLSIMRSRAATLKAALSVAPGTKSGTVVTCAFPLRS